MRVLIDIVEDVVTSASHTKATDILWPHVSSKPPLQPRLVLNNVLEMLLQNGGGRPLLLAQVLAAGPPELPRTFLWHRTQNDDLTNDADVYLDDHVIESSIFDVRNWNAPMPLFVALVVYFTTVAAVPFAEAQPALEACLEHTLDRASIAHARVGIRHTTLFAYCCALGESDYALSVLDSIVPTTDRAAYMCVLDRATFAAEHYAHIGNLAPVIARLRKEMPCVRPAVPRTMSNDALPPPRRAAAQKKSTPSLQKTTTLIPGEPIQVRLRARASKRAEEEAEAEAEEEEVALSWASMRTIQSQPAAEFVECISLPLPGAAGYDNNIDDSFYYDSAAMAHAPRYVPLTALGFRPDGFAADAVLHVEDLAALLLSAPHAQKAAQIFTFRVGDDRVQVMPLVDFQQMLPGQPFLVDADAQAPNAVLNNPFVSFAPDEQRALTRYHRDWDKAINGLLEFDAANAVPDGIVSPRKLSKFFDEFLKANDWRVFSKKSMRAAAQNVVYTQRLIDRAFRRAQPLLRDTIVYHGTDLGVIDVPQSARHPEFVSSSPTLEVAQSFANEGCVLRITLPRGLPVIYVEPFAVEHTGENELLLPRELVFSRSDVAPRMEAWGMNPPTPMIDVSATLSSVGRQILLQKDNELLLLPEEVTAIGSSHIEHDRDGDYGGWRPRCKLMRIVQPL